MFPPSLAGVERHLEFETLTFSIQRLYLQKDVSLGHQQTDTLHSPPTEMLIFPPSLLRPARDEVSLDSKKLNFRN